MSSQFNEINIAETAYKDVCPASLFAFPRLSVVPLSLVCMRRVRLAEGKSIILAFNHSRFPYFANRKTS